MAEKNEGTVKLEGHPLESPAGSEAAKVEGKGTEGGQKIRFGSHEFNSIEELTQAYQKLESTVGEQGRKIGELKSIETGRVAAPTRARRTLDFKKLGDVIIENPEAGVKEIVGYVEETVEERIAAEREVAAAEGAKVAREERIWDQFFGANPWLEHRREEVKAVAYGPLWQRIGGKSQDEQFRMMADHFREATVRSVDVLEGKPLASAHPATVVPGSPSGGTGIRPKTEEQKPKSFLDSVKEMSHVPKPAF